MLAWLEAHPVWGVFLFALATALATGLGALPFLFMRTVSARTVASSNAVAAGLMLGASFGLMVEASARGPVSAVVGANLGVLFVFVTSWVLRSRDVDVGRLRSANARKMILIIVVMTVHSAAEGIAVGASFGGGAVLATVITVAIAVHNVPEGLAISAVLRPQGASVTACAGWSVFSSLPQPLLAVPAFLFVDAVRPALPYAMGFAGGAMVLMVLFELLPEAYEEGRRATVGVLVSVPLFVMILFQELL
jgi:ZIP family zinc transporter